MEHCSIQSSRNGKSMAQLKTYKDIAIHLNWQGKENINQRSSQEAHDNMVVFRSRALHAIYCRGCMWCLIVFIY